MIEGDIIAANSQKQFLSGRIQYNYFHIASYGQFESLSKFEIEILNIFQRNERVGKWLMCKVLTKENSNKQRYCTENLEIF